MYLFDPPGSFIDADQRTVEKLVSGRIVIHHRHPYAIRPLDGMNPEASLSRAVRLLGEPLSSGKTANWWVGVGTALGLAREGGFITGDTDIDIRVGLPYTSKDRAFQDAREMVERFKANSFRLIREMFWNGLLMQTAFADEQNSDLIVDIYYFYSGIYEGSLVNFNEHGFRRKPERLVVTKALMSWPGHPEIQVHVPSPVEDYLLWRFGPEWRIKKKNSQLGRVDKKCIEALPDCTVLTYGTFDLLHFGHKRLLRRARSLGDQMVVGVVSDEICRLKGKYPEQNEEQRAEAVRRCRGVDAVFIQRTLDQKEYDIDRYGASRLVVGDDWAQHPRFEAVRSYHGVQIVYLRRTPLISTSLKKLLSFKSRSVA